MTRALNQDAHSTLNAGEKIEIYFKNENKDFTFPQFLHNEAPGATIESLQHGHAPLFRAQVFRHCAWNE